MSMPDFWRTFKSRMVRDAVAADEHIREGRFQKTLSLMAGLSSILSGLEVTYEHYRGSYGQKVMYSPVILSPILLIAGVWGFFSRMAARTVLPIVSAVTLVDSVVGFGFHIRGIHRKPGGWRVPIANLIMGPPVFAPLLFGISGYLGLIAGFLRREDAPADDQLHPVLHPMRTLLELHHGGQDHEPKELAVPSDNEPSEPNDAAKQSSWEQDVREGKFQKHLAAATAAASLFSGVEALYSHYKNNFRYLAQWSPVILSPILTVVAITAVFNKKAAKFWLPILSILAMIDGGIGFFYHIRGILRRPGGRKLPLYNVIYGPPVLAPLLFAACGALGVLASLMRRED